MFLNGAAIGMVNIAVMRKPNLRNLYQARTVLVVAADGATARGTRAFRFVAVGFPASVASTLASALPAVQNRFVKQSRRPRIAKSEVRDERSERQCATCNELLNP